MAPKSTQAIAIAYRTSTKPRLLLPPLNGLDIEDTLDEDNNEDNELVLIERLRTVRAKKVLEVPKVNLE